jgi:hypothetical protein
MAYTQAVLQASLGSIARGGAGWNYSLVATGPKLISELSATTRGRGVTLRLPAEGSLGGAEGTVSPQRQLLPRISLR